MPKTFEKDTAAKLDYRWDWTDWLNDDIISTYEFTIPEGLVQESDSEEDGKVTLWLSGGEDGKSYTVACKILTVGGRRDERVAIFELIENR